MTRTEAEDDPSRTSAIHTLIVTGAAFVVLATVLFAMNDGHRTAVPLAPVGSPAQSPS